MFTWYARGVVPIDDKLMKKSDDGATHVVWLVACVRGKCGSTPDALHAMHGFDRNCVLKRTSVFRTGVFFAHSWHRCGSTQQILDCGDITPENVVAL